MRSICIIPARGGSKRLPRKNVRPFLGKPILAYPIQAALQSGLFDVVMVSTDDDEIAGISRQWGAKVPFLRSPETSGDHAIIAEVLAETLHRYAGMGLSFDLACCILPTSALIRQIDLLSARAKLVEEELDCVFPACRFSYPIWRSLKMEEGRLRMNWPENYAKRSQDLPEAFHDSGQFYWFRVDRFLVSGKLFTDNTGGILLAESQVQDIDSEEDWRMCEMKYRLLHPGCEAT